MQQRARIIKMMFLRFWKSHHAYVDWLWQTEMEGQTSLTVEIVVPKDVWISKILSGYKFLMVAWLFTELYGWKVEQIKKTPPGDNVIPEPRWNRVNGLKGASCSQKNLELITNMNSEKSIFLCLQVCSSLKYWTHIQ